MSSPCGVPGEVHAGGAVHCSPAKGRRGETHTTWGNAFLGLTMLQLTLSPAGLSLLLSRKKRIIKGCGFLAWFWRKKKKGFLGLQRAASEGHVGVQGVDVQVDLGDPSGHLWHPAEGRQSPHGSFTSLFADCAASRQLLQRSPASERKTGKRKQNKNSQQAVTCR